MKKNYYELLGVDKNASKDEIKKAFRKKAMEYHPDKNNGDDKKFKEINEAYTVLSDEKKKQNYDNFGSADAGAGFGGGQGFGGFDFSQAQGFGGGQGFEFDLGDIFGDFFGGGRNSSQRVKKGSDLQVELDISFRDSILGVKKSFKIKKNKICNICNGTGAEKDTKFTNCDTCNGEGIINEVQHTPFGSMERQKVCPSCDGEGKIPEKKCKNCHGSGIILEDEEVNVSIPAGIENGQKMIIRGGGNQIKNGHSGDLYIYMNVEDSNIFERFGNNLYSKINIKYSTAVLGGEIDVKTVDGNKKIKIPQGIQSDTKLKIKSAGVKDKGDLYVEIKIEVPEKIDKKTKKLIEELKNAGL